MSKTILVTGASSGFGRDTVQTLAAAGHRVFASMRDIADRNLTHSEHLRAQGIDVVELDVTSEPSVERAVAAVLAKVGRLDVLVNNAGIGSAGVSESFSTQQLQDLFDVNVFGIQRTLRAALPAFRAQGSGLVINIGSVLGRVTLPFMGLYGASKFALEALSDSYRYELSQLGVDVVLVQPSAYPTNIFAHAQQPADGARGEAYGEIGTIPYKMIGAFTERFASAQAPNPHDVAIAIARLVEQPAGARPARVVVGDSLGADAINSQSNAVQAVVLDELGLRDLAQPRAVAVAA